MEKYILIGTVVFVVFCCIMALFEGRRKPKKIWMRDGGAFGQRERYTYHYNRKGKRTGKSVRYY